MISIHEQIPAIPWVAQENKRFIEMLRGLDVQSWKRPTYCTGWFVADVVAHMTLGARFYAHVIPAGKEGRLEMPFGAEDLETFWAYRSRVGEELAALPGEERVDRFEAAVNDLQVVFEDIHPEDMEKEAWHWMCPCPIHSYPGQRLYELILHDWDIRNEPEGNLHPDALGMATDILDFRLPFFFNHTPDLELSGRFRFQTENPSRVWAMGLEGGHAEPISSRNDQFDAQFFSSSSDILLLTTGRADLAYKMKTGHLRIEGDRLRAEKLMNILCKPF
jgi:uncharacterized protein (TIGR03083 family)